MSIKDEEKRPAKKKQSTKSTNFNCFVCNITLPTKKKLYQHIHSHNEFPCKQCTKTFNDFRKYKKHAIFHSKAKSIPCDTCGKLFRYYTNMKRHRKKHETTTHKCPYCEEYLTSAALLGKHLEKEHSHFKEFSCDICEKKFFKRHNLNLHMLIHTGIKKHTCEVCGLSFTLHGNLVSHQRLHTGEKPYSCNHCGKCFTQQSALRSHEAGKRLKICYHTNVSLT